MEIYNWFLSAIFSPKPDKCSKKVKHSLSHRPFGNGKKSAISPHNSSFNPCSGFFLQFRRVCTPKSWRASLNHIPLKSDPYKGIVWKWKQEQFFKQFEWLFSGPSEASGWVKCFIRIEYNASFLRIKKPCYHFFDKEKMTVEAFLFY